MHEGVAQVFLFILAIGGAIGMYYLGYLSGQYDAEQKRKKEEK